MTWEMFAVEEVGKAYLVTVYPKLDSSGWGAWCAATQVLKYVFSTWEEVKEFINNSLSNEGEVNEIQKTK